MTFSVASSVVLSALLCAGSAQHIVGPQEASRECGDA